MKESQQETPYKGCKQKGFSSSVDLLQKQFFNLLNFIIFFSVESSIVRDKLNKNSVSLNFPWRHPDTLKSRQEIPQR